MKYCLTFLLITALSCGRLDNNPSHGQYFCDGDAPSGFRKLALFDPLGNHLTPSATDINFFPNNNIERRTDDKGCIEVQKDSSIEATHIAIKDSGLIAETSAIWEKEQNFSSVALQPEINNANLGLLPCRGSEITVNDWKQLTLAGNGRPQGPGHLTSQLISQGIIVKESIIPISKLSSLGDGALFPHIAFLADGSYTVESRFVSLGGQEHSITKSPCRINYDTVAPYFVESNIKYGIQAGQAFQWQLNEEGIKAASVSLKLGQQEWEFDLLASAPITLPRPGSWQLTFRLEDHAGNVNRFSRSIATPEVVWPFRFADIHYANDMVSPEGMTVDGETSIQDVIDASTFTPVIVPINGQLPIEAAVAFDVQVCPSQTAHPCDQMQPYEESLPSRLAAGDWYLHFLAKDAAGNETRVSHHAYISPAAFLSWCMQNLDNYSQWLSSEDIFISWGSLIWFGCMPIERQVISSDLLYLAGWVGPNFNLFSGNQQIKTIMAVQSDIISLGGGIFPEVQSINLVDNSRLTSLEGLHSFPALKKLEIRNSPVQSLLPLDEAHSLEELILDGDVPAVL